MVPPSPNRSRAEAQGARILNGAAYPCIFCSIALEVSGASPINGSRQVCKNSAPEVLKSLLKRNEIVFLDKAIQGVERMARMEEAESMCGIPLNPTPKVTYLPLRSGPRRPGVFEECFDLRIGRSFSDGR